MPPGRLTYSTKSRSGLRQLHSIDVAHQDVKPSNVLLYDSGETKVGDLGCASRRGSESPRDNLKIAGDRTYAPIELLYGYASPDWTLRRITTDLYQLGNLCFFLMQGISLTTRLLERLDRAHHPKRWKGTYEEVFDYVSHIHGACINEFAMAVSAGIRDELVQLVDALTNPDPKRRGHPKTVSQRHNKHNLERVVSSFNRLAFRARLDLRTRLA